MSEHRNPCAGWIQVGVNGFTWVALFLWFQDSFLFSLAAGLEELVLSEINSPSRSQPTGDSSSVSSFSYKDMMKETQTTNQNKVSEASSPVLACGAFCSLLYAVSHFPAVFKVPLFLVPPVCSRQHLLIERLFIEQTASVKRAERFWQTAVGRVSVCLVMWLAAGISITVGIN